MHWRAFEPRLVEPGRRHRERAAGAGDGDHQGGGARARQRGRQQPDQGEIVEGPPSAARQARPKPEEGDGAFLAEARERYAEEVAWRTRAADELLPGLSTYADAIRHSIGLRVQERLTNEQARLVAECPVGPPRHLAATSESNAWTP